MIISKKQFLAFLAVILFLITSATSSNIKEVMCVQRDRQALLKFKAGLIDDFGGLSSWENEVNCCKWDGVVCDNRTNRVVVLDLSEIQTLVGNMIAPSLLELNELSYLDLSNIKFYGIKIPEVIGSLTKLSYLNLRQCYFNGGIPNSLGKLTMLQFLDLSGALYKGPGASRVRIPDNLWNLTCLAYLDLSDNSIEGIVGNSFENLTSLSYLDLSNNLLQGRIPSLENLTSLYHLVLSNNALEGRILTSLENLTSLSYLDLSFNHLQGEFSNHLSGLLYLDLSNNHELEGDFTNLMSHLWNSTSLEHIDLSKNVFFGSLPNMSRFQHLKELRLNENHLNGSIGEDNLRLPALEFLDLSRNKLFGMIPNLSSCSSLREIHLDDNMFNGTLTESIGNLFNLEELNLSSNHLEGLISEAHLFNLSELRILDLSFNSNLTISFNPPWTPPFQLNSILLANCRFGPHFPQWLQTQRRIRSLDISNSKICDTIPDWFWNNFEEVEYLNMSHNDIHGTLPSLSFISIGYAYVDFSVNQLSGTLPPMPSSATAVMLSSNKFFGTVVYCNFSVDILDISNNLLSGHISRGCFKNLSLSAYLNLANNNFSGNIQVSRSRCRLSSLHLRNNNFTGYIPRSLGSCLLNVLDLGENKFLGTIPSWLGESMDGLIVLSLKSNQLHGSLPSTICLLSTIQVLDISGNKISGTVPKCISNFTKMSSELNFTSIGRPFVLGSLVINFYNNVGPASFNDRIRITWKGELSEYVNTLWLLKVIDFSSNKFFGEIPHEITSLVELVSLNLSRNNLIGSIPRDINRLELLDVLDLSWNNLSGGIPSTISQMSHLGVLNLSYNNLSGNIPWETHMSTFGASSYIGNPRLCCHPLVSESCPKGSDIPREPILMNGAHKDTLMTREFYTGMMFGFSIAFLGVFGTLFSNRRWNIALANVFSSIDDWLLENDS